MIFSSRLCGPGVAAVVASFSLPRGKEFTAEAQRARRVPFHDFFCAVSPCSASPRLLHLFPFQEIEKKGPFSLNSVLTPTRGREDAR